MSWSAHLASLVIWAWAFAPTTEGCAQSEQLPFELLPELPVEIGVGGPITGSHEGALIVGGGANFPVPLVEGGEKVWHDEVFVLLESAGPWREAGRLPRRLAYAACTSTELGIVVAGGSDEDSVYREVYLLEWFQSERRLGVRDLPALPEPSAFGAAQAIGRKVYVLGGKRSKDDKDLSGAFWELDLDDLERGWVGLPPLPGPPRFKVVSAVQGDVTGEVCLFVFSGSLTAETGEGKPLFQMFTDAHRFSPSSGDWSGLAQLPVLEDPRALPGGANFEDSRWPINAGCAARYGESEILTFSGSTGRYIVDGAGDIVPPSERPDFAARVLAYDVLEDAWAEAGSMPVGVVTTAAEIWDGRIVIPSGEVRPGIRTPMVQALLVPGTGDDSISAHFGGLDYLVLALYLALMLAVGVYFARREKSTEDFFLAGRKIPWWAAGLSIFGTQLSAITFMAIPATAYGSDWRRIVGQLMLLPVLLIVIHSFLPLFRRLEVTTAYEFLEARFSLAVRLLASAIFILFQLGRMGIVLLLPAIALSAVTGIDTYLCIALMGVLATIYTTLGGISAVIWTDVLQVVVLIGGALLCLAVAIVDVGGVGPMVEAAMASEKLHIFDWEWGATDMVAWVLIVGFFFTNLVPYTTDQTVIQRYLTTRDQGQAAKSLWLNLVITIPTGLLFFGLGTALFVYYSAHPGEQAQLPEKADQLVPWFVVTHLPTGVAGVVVAGIFAAAMSSLDSSMNSISTAVVNDFVGRLQQPGKVRNYLGLARVLTVVLGVVGTGAAMFLATYEIKYLFDFFQKVLGLFGGSLAGVFLLAVFSRRTNAVGALVGLISGAALTIAVAFLTDLNFLLYAAIGNLGCVIIGYTTSLFIGGPGQDPNGLLESRNGGASRVAS